MKTLWAQHQQSNNNLEVKHTNSTYKSLIAVLHLDQPPYEQLNLSKSWNRTWTMNISWTVESISRNAHNLAQIPWASELDNLFNSALPKEGKIGRTLNYQNWKKSFFWITAVNIWQLRYLSILSFSFGKRGLLSLFLKYLCSSSGRSIIILHVLYVV